MDINKFWKEIRDFKKNKDSKESLMEKDGFRLLNQSDQDYSNPSIIGMDLDEIFEHLRKRPLQEILIENGFKCLNNLYSDDLAYDFEGVSTLKINSDFSSLDNDLSGLIDLKINIKDKKISLNNVSYCIKTVNHIFGGIGDYDKPESGMMYLKVINDYLNKNGIKKIVFLITDTMVSEISGLCISDSSNFQKVQHVLNYIEHLNRNNREKAIKLAQDETYELRGIELLTNYKGFLIQKGPMIHVVE